MICSRVSMKILQIAVPKFATESWDEANYRNAAELLKMFLGGSDQHLVQVSIVAPAKLLLKSFGESVHSCEFPRLKSFQVDVTNCRYSRDYNRTQLLTIVGDVIVNNAPRLEQLDVGNLLSFDLEDSNRDHEARIENSVTTILKYSKAVVICGENPFRPARLSDACLHRLAFKHLRPFFESWPHCAAMGKLIRNSGETLTSAHCKAVSLLVILLEGTSLPHLNQLRLDVDFRSLRENSYQSYLGTLLCIEAWKLCFPNLKTLKLQDGYNVSESEFLKQLKERFQEARKKLPQGASQSSLPIETLNLNCTLLWLTIPELKLISKLCSQVKTLSKHVRSYDSIFPLGFDLNFIEYLELDFEDLDLDGLICGMGCEERRALRRKDVKFLKAVHIVPRQAPLTHLVREIYWIADLKTLKLILHVTRWISMCNKDRNVVSRLSAGIGFSRIPGLVVELDIIPAAQVCKQAAEEIQREFLDTMKDFPEVEIKAEILQG